MRVRLFSAGLLLALVTSPTYGPGTLEHVSSNLRPVGKTLRISCASSDVAPGLDSTRGPLIAVRSWHSVGVVDASSLRWTASYRLPHVGVCDAGFDGRTPGALVGCGRYDPHYAIA